MFITLRGELAAYLNILRGVKSSESESEDSGNFLSPLENLIDSVLPSGFSSGGFFDKIIGKESSGDPNAKNPMPGSTSSGLYGMTDATAEYIGNKYGIPYADKNNPVLAEALRHDNAQILTGSLGREPSLSEERLAWFAGAGGAVKLINANPAGYGAVTLPKAAEWNPNVFYNDMGDPRTNKQVIDYVTKGF